MVKQQKVLYWIMSYTFVVSPHFILDVLRVCAGTKNCKCMAMKKDGKEEGVKRTTKDSKVNHASCFHPLFLTLIQQLVACSLFLNAPFHVQWALLWSSWELAC